MRHLPTPPSQSNAHEDVHILHVRQNSLGILRFHLKEQILLRLLYAPAELDIRMKVTLMELPSSETHPVAKSL